MTKEKISVTIDSELIEWIDEQIKTRRFRNRSHGIEYAVAKLVESES